jgi:1-acyl-sn-glycerol-3-phosphate acyltransferase
MFPEGTRSVDGTLQAFKVGIAVLAVEHQVPIVPVRIDRAYELFPKGHRIVRPGTIHVSFGEAIPPPKVDDSCDHYATFARLARQVQDAVVRLGHEVGA